MDHSYFEKYLQYRNQLDSVIEQLTLIHKPHLNCAKGCDLCCFSFRVFPVEFFAIANEMKSEATPNLNLEIGEMEKCLFLNNHQCSIYPFRPIICRTHGLPLLNMNEEGTDWELNICELNFTEADDEVFDNDNVLMQDKINSELFQINKAFIENNPQLNLSEFDLIPLKALHNQ